MGPLGVSRGASTTPYGFTLYRVVVTPNLIKKSSKFYIVHALGSELEGPTETPPCVDFIDSAERLIHSHDSSRARARL